MTGRSWLRGAIVVAAGVMFAVAIISPAAYSRGKKAAVATPTDTPTPTATPTPEAKVWNFDQDKAHAAPPGWTAVEGDWEVIPDPSAPSQANTYGLPAGRTVSSLMHGLAYNLVTVMTDPTEYADFTLEASFKSASGRFDCSGGLIFRYVNPQNFYVLSAGCPSDYFALSRMTNGKLENLKQQVVPTDKDTWYKLKVWAQGTHFTCYDDNKMIFDVDDAKIAKGRIGLWASNDSQARFDDLTLTLPLAGAGGSSTEATPVPPPPASPPGH
jgi:hypothetical protein